MSEDNTSSVARPVGRVAKPQLHGERGLSEIAARVKAAIEAAPIGSTKIYSGHGISTADVATLADAVLASPLTVEGAQARRAALIGDAARVCSLIECCVNAEAAFSMMGCKPVKGNAFRPVGVQTLMQIRELLAQMPGEAALVKASMAFACEFCGCPAETGNDDCWICESCCRQADGEGRQA